MSPHFTGRATEVQSEVTCPQVHSQQGAGPAGLPTPPLCTGPTSPVDILNKQECSSGGKRPGPTRVKCGLWGQTGLGANSDPPGTSCDHRQSLESLHLISTSAKRETAPSREGCLRSGERLVKQSAQALGAEEVLHEGWPWLLSAMSLFLLGLETV